MFSLFLKTNTQANRKLLLEAMRKKPVEEMCMADDYEKYLHQLLSDGMFIRTDRSICPLSYLYTSIYNCYIILVTGDTIEKYQYNRLLIQY